ncbi:hypothetical protein [Flavobacterium fluviale]|uniref:Uncharacterized protein n=1 Tax=Flavobacterium fluviale TaxID=2249356 RepID=A0A344LPJ9_9FLAO|nr:hypothetical protein [Flavobacterium fluviale]AXB55841.1 hypothetical protein HYN86_04175 [Flavobacterium fluviale]
MSFDNSSFSFYDIVATFRKKAIVTESSAIVTNVFITKEIEFKEVEYVYVEFFNLCFETKNKKKICLNLIRLKSLDLEENLYEKLKKYRKF